MELLSHFRVFHYCGIWYESHEKYRLLKYTYKTVIVSTVFILLASQFIGIATIQSTAEEVTESLFLSLACFGCCVKLSNFLFRRKSMKKILAAFRSEICRAKTTEEDNLMQMNKRLITKLHKIVLGVGLTTGFLFLITPLQFLLQEGIKLLPVRAYHPYDMENNFNFIITYVYQVIALTYTVFINVTFDMFPCGLMLLTCAQFELCNHRLLRSQQGEKIESVIRQCIEHQVLLRETVRRMQSFFMGTVLIHFCCILIVLCTSVFKTSQTSLFSMEFFQLTTYLMSMLNQCFFYCWSGNELQLKSREIVRVIYEFDWTDLKLVDKKNLLIIMLLSQGEITVSYHGICAMSLQVFVWIIKTSYAAYNLLQSVSE